MNRRQWFKQQLAKYDRIALCGVVNGGKSTLARLVKDRPVIHTDDFRDYAWADVPFRAIDEIDTMGTGSRFVIEGMQVPRTLRKGLVVDAVLWLPQELEHNSKGQMAMGKAASTVLAEWSVTHQDVPLLTAPPVQKNEDPEDED